MTLTRVPPPILPERPAENRRRAPTAPTPSRGGGYIFAPDLHLRADETTPFWRPDLLIDYVCLVPERRGAGDLSGIVFDLAAWPGSGEIFFAADGLHILAHVGFTRCVRLWLPQRTILPKPGTPFGIYIQPDAYARERAEIALRFCRETADPAAARVPPAPLSWPQRNHARLAAMLYASDLRAAGFGQRAIAERVLGASPGPDWASSHERSALRRLLRDAARYVARDYRDLLRPPKRQGRS
nr:DUF2285 domain-containing protein [Jannaschia rubra]